jgi:hypothetical protein
MAFPISMVDFAMAALMPDSITASATRSMCTPPESAKAVVPLLIISRHARRPLI